MSFIKTVEPGDTEYISQRIIIDILKHGKYDAFKLHGSLRAFTHFSVVLQSSKNLSLSAFH